jgi:repressor LexA
MSSGFDKLHPTQERLLQELSDVDGVRPSLRELGRRIGIASPNTVAHHLRQLERKGYLIPRGEEGQFDVVREPVRDVVYIPLYGNAACGREEFFCDGNLEERVPLPARTLGITPECFLVRARGNSMEPSIHDRDLLLVQPQQVAENGQIVVVALEEGVYAKQFARGRHEVFLHSLNSDYKTVPVESGQQFWVLGVVRGVLRRWMR